MKSNSILFAVVILLMTFHEVYGQKQPVSWDISLDSTNRDRCTIVFLAQIQPAWHLYSQQIEEGGPMPTEFHFTGSDYRTIGSTHEAGKRIVYHDSTYDMQVSYYGDRVVFSQRIELLKKTGFVKGSIEFMICSGELCMPGKKEFSIPIPSR